MPPSKEFVEYDHYGILAEMRANGSYVDNQHIVYKAGTHGEKYLDKDAYLQQTWVAWRVARLLAEGIQKWSIIVAPETRSKIKLVNMVGEMCGCTVIPTVKNEEDQHTIDENLLRDIDWEAPLILIDDIFNNGTTYYQIQAFLAARWLNVDEFRVMVDRNPEKSGTTGIPMFTLSATQMDQWDERKVPMNLMKKPISTKLGKGRNWVPQSGAALGDQFLAERLAKEDLGFRLDDGMIVVPGQQTEWQLVQDKGGTKKGDRIQMEIDGDFVVTV